MDLVVVWWSFDGYGCCLVVICRHGGRRGVVCGRLMDLGSTFRQHQKMIQSTILAQSYQHELSGHSLRPPERHECIIHKIASPSSEKKAKKSCSAQKGSKRREGTRRIKATILHQKTEQRADGWRKEKKKKKHTRGWCRGCKTVKKRIVF